MIRVQAYQADFGACWGYRLYWPLGTLERFLPNQFQCPITHKMVPEEIEKADIILLQRQVRGASFNNVMTARARRGTKFIYEADDDFLNLPPWNPHYDFFHDPVVQNNLKIYLEEADAIFVSTETLRKAYSQYNNRIFVLPNSIHPRHVPVRLRNNRVPSIGWVGSGTHRDDFARVEKSLDQFKDRDDVLIKMFSNRSYTGANVQYIKWVEWTDYYTTLSLLDLDVIVVPLEDHQFNRCKSNIRWLEASLVGTPVIASNVGPYAESIENEKTGILINDDSEWVPQINRLLQDREFAESLVANAREEVLDKFNIEKNYQLWARAIKNVHDRAPRKTKRTYALRQAPDGPMMNVASAAKKAPLGA